MKNFKALTQYYEVGRFCSLWEATGRQMSYINVLCQQVGCTLEEVLESMWGMNMVAAFSDRPWMRLTKGEASRVIKILLVEKGDCGERPRVAV